jgi:ATP-binding cassette subfamily F protein 3
VSVIEVAGLKFGYTNEPLFENVTFRLEPGERAALVAPNGAGKSTLLRVLAGEVPPDSGYVVIKKGASVAYYRQSHETRLRGSVLDALLAGFGDLVTLRHELTAAQAAAASGERAALDQLAELTERYHHAGADALEHRVEAIATRLGFAKSDLERDVTTLSGGERGRLELGLTLAADAELLLLDEPTNHLDLDTIRWLEGYLGSLRAAAVIVSHDRAFLDAACPHTFELGRRVFRTYPLAYSAYQAARAEDLERERKLAEEQAAFVAKTEDFIRKNLAGQKTKQAQSRRKMLEKLDRVEGPEDIWARAERVRFRFAEAPRSGDIVLEANGLTAERGGTTLFSGIDMLIRRGDRIGIVGPNGCGKSTLLKLLAGRGDASDRGEVRRGTNLRDGYFDQQLGSLDESKTGVEEVRSIRGDLNDDGAREYLARFRFWGDDPLRRVASLSGGERTPSSCSNRETYCSWTNRRTTSTFPRARFSKRRSSASRVPCSWFPTIGASSKTSRPERSRSRRARWTSTRGAFATTAKRSNGSGERKRSKLGRRADASAPPRPRDPKNRQKRPRARLRRAPRPTRPAVTRHVT